MTLRKTGTCADCKKPLYGDDYGAAGHQCKAAPKLRKRKMVARFRRLQKDLGFTAEEAFVDCLEEMEIAKDE